MGLVRVFTSPQTSWIWDFIVNAVIIDSFCSTFFFQTAAGEAYILCNYKNGVNTCLILSDIHVCKRSQGMLVV